MSAELEGARVLIVTSNTGVERDELLIPRDQLRARGAHVIHAAAEEIDVHTYRHDLIPSEPVRPDIALGDVDAGAFDVLVIPGGTVNADKLRTDAKAIELVRSAIAADRPIAAICHGPWLLVEAAVVAGKTLTSYPSLRTDLINAGAVWIDESVVRSDAEGWTLITSRNPDDLPDFVDAIAAELTVRTS
ncbi:type 1 glutamine amidotransferase domain-containing protein [Nocardia niigatensis]|uniref:type 1 glutamine amidotransferase domain-containing protein n=1 Tax=Nocardia niigatensis TaxID=209249 RepID=UPI0002DA1882|nr:type 1 glutamine amidotransferase domain-containing protein [Nocardia niigatensis]